MNFGEVLQLIKREYPHIRHKNVDGDLIVWLDETVAIPQSLPILPFEEGATLPVAGNWKEWRRYTPQRAAISGKPDLFLSAKEAADFIIQWVKTSAIEVDPVTGKPRLGARAVIPVDGGHDIYDNGLLQTKVRRTVGGEFRWHRRDGFHVAHFAKHEGGLNEH